MSFAYRPADLIGLSLGAAALNDEEGVEVPLSLALLLNELSSSASTSKLPQRLRNESSVSSPMAVGVPLPELPLRSLVADIRMSPSAAAVGNTSAGGRRTVNRTARRRRRQ